MHQITKISGVALALALGVAGAASAQVDGDLSAGDVLTGTSGSLQDAVQTTLDGVLSGGQTELPPGAVDEILASSPGAAGAPGATGGQGATGSPGGAGTATGGAGDVRAPVARVRVAARLARIGRTGRLVLEVTSDEPGLVAVGSMMRPGERRRGVPRRKAHRRTVIHVPAVTLTFRRAGMLAVGIRLSKHDQRRLGRSRDARISLAIVSADASGNQAAWRIKRRMRR